MGNGISCKKCNVDLVPTIQSKSLTISGVLGFLLFIIGVVIGLFNMIVGGLIIILGLVISFSAKRKITVMKCPSCGSEGLKL